MADLIARGDEPDKHWRRTLPDGQVIELGRTAYWSVPWDHHISRSHARMLWDPRSQTLHIKRFPWARNPIFFENNEIEQAEIKPDQAFTIGKTHFSLSSEKVVFQPIDSQALMQEQVFASKELRGLSYRDAQSRIDVLGKLPELIAGASNELDLYSRLSDLLLAGIPQADVAAIIAVIDDGGRTASDSSNRQVTRDQVRVLHWDRRALALGGDFRPSTRLIIDAMTRGQSTMHIWRGLPRGSELSADSTSDGGGGGQYTMALGSDWAFCIPLPGVVGGRGIYVTGSFRPGLSRTVGSNDPSDLREDIKFTELVASILCALMQSRDLQKRQTSLGQFLSPVVMRSILEADPEEVLAPRETDVSVLFCDLRGFSRAAERNANDLLGLLNRVSEALGIMTKQILDRGGVIGDFHGDAAMGFWGWPLTQRDSMERACQAALTIRSQFQERVGAALAGSTDSINLSAFKMGIGIASGRAVAGRIGTTDQGKISVFGPVVNLASRLEGLTKYMHAPILLDEVTAKKVRLTIDPKIGRFRRVARVQPYGLSNPLEVTELLPPAGALGSLPEESLIDYERGLDAFLAGHWVEALKLFNRVCDEDQVKDFLVEYILQHKRQTPPNWTGTIMMEAK